MPAKGEEDDRGLNNNLLKNQHRQPTARQQQSQSFTNPQPSMSNNLQQKVGEDMSSVHLKSNYISDGSSSTSNYPLTNIATPSDNDVMCGRENNNHIGNTKYRTMIKSNKSLYQSITDFGGKKKFAQSVVSKWRSQSPPGRFLSKDNVTNLWNDIGDKATLSKVHVTQTQEKSNYTPITNEQTRVVNDQSNNRNVSVSRNLQGGKGLHNSSHGESVISYADFKEGELVVVEDHYKQSEENCDHPVKGGIARVVKVIESKESNEDGITIYDVKFVNEPRTLQGVDEIVLSSYEGKSIEPSEDWSRKKRVTKEKSLDEPSAKKAKKGLPFVIETPAATSSGGKTDKTLHRPNPVSATPGAKTVPWNASQGTIVEKPVSATPAAKTSLPKQLQAPMSGNNNNGSLPTVLDKRLQATTADSNNNGSLSIDKEAATSSITSTAESEASARTPNNTESIDDKLSKGTDWLSVAGLMREAQIAQLQNDYKSVDESKTRVVDCITKIHEEESKKHRVDELVAKEAKVEKEIGDLKEWQSKSQEMGLATAESMALSNSKIKTKDKELAIIQGHIQDQSKIKQQLKEKCLKKFNEDMNRLDEYLEKRKEAWLTFAGRMGISEDDVRVNRDTSWKTRWDDWNQLNHFF